MNEVRDFVRALTPTITLSGPDVEAYVYDVIRVAVDMGRATAYEARLALADVDITQVGHPLLGELGLLEARLLEANRKRQADRARVMAEEMGSGG